MNSIWTESTERPTFPTLSGDLKTDVLIIGGGITGILTAYKLKSSGVDCTVVEADRILSGITKNTTAKVTLQHALIYGRLIKERGEEIARLYLAAQMDACREYERLAGNISCDYEKKDAFVYSTRDRARIEAEVAALERLGLGVDFFESLPIPVEIKGAARVKNQAQLHPLKFLYAIAKDLTVYEKTKVLELAPRRAVTEHGEISAERIVVATHFPLINKHGSYFMKMHQHRSYVIAMKNAQNVEGMYVDEDEKGLSFRNYGELLLLGGGSHRTGKAGGGWRELEAFAGKHYPDSVITAKWATQDCMTLDGVPYIGRYSLSTTDLYVATGFNKWGFTSAMTAASLLTDIITEKKTDLAEVFSPSRSILRPQLAVNAFEYVVGLINPVAPRCPHLGCALKYNKQEHTWDCPCHGSRFAEDGTLLDNPATADKRNMPGT